MQERTTAIALALALLAVCSSCAKLAPTPVVGDGTILVENASGRGEQVLIRKVDDGELLFVWGLELGDRVFISPGRHKIAVVCKKDFRDGYNLVHSEVEVDARAGRTYELEIERFEKTDPNRRWGYECDVLVRERDAE